MFTGIVEETGIVRSFTEQAQAWRLVLEARVVTEGLQLGDSVAIERLLPDGGRVFGRSSGV